MKTCLNSEFKKLGKEIGQISYEVQVTNKNVLKEQMWGLKYYDYKYKLYYFFIICLNIATKLSAKFARKIKTNTNVHNAPFSIAILNALKSTNKGLDKGSKVYAKW